METRKDLIRFKNFKKGMALGASLLPLCTYGAVYASGDAVSAMQNLNDFIFDLLAAAGILIFVICLVFFISSFASHDTGQRIGGVMGIIGGLMFVFLKNILISIGIM